MSASSSARTEIPPGDTRRDWATRTMTAALTNWNGRLTFVGQEAPPGDAAGVPLPKRLPVTFEAEPVWTEADPANATVIVHPSFAHRRQADARDHDPDGIPPSQIVGERGKSVTDDAEAVQLRAARHGAESRQRRPAQGGSPTALHATSNRPRKLRLHHLRVPPPADRFHRHRCRP